MMASILKPAATAAAVTALAGCMSLAPKYERPQAPVRSDWRVETATATGPSAQDLPWAQFFADPRLRSLIELTLANNRDLRIATLNIERTRALYQIQRAQLFPSVVASGSGNNQRISGELSPTGQPEISRSVSAAVGIVSYEVDLFGRIRSLNEQAAYQYLATEESRRAAQIALVSEVAGQWLALATDLERLQIAEETYKAQQQTLDLIRRSNELGVTSGLDVRQAQVLLETARRDRAVYTSLVAQDRNALELLAGAPISPGMEPTAPLPSGIAQVSDLPPGVPSEVLARRPDVVASERQLQAANANIGAARAAFFPRCRSA